MADSDGRGSSRSRSNSPLEGGEACSTLGQQQHQQQEPHEQLEQHEQQQHQWQQQEQQEQLRFIFQHPRHWTSEEDTLLLRHALERGTRRWGELESSRRLPRRDNKSCCNRFLFLKKRFLEQRGRIQAVLAAGKSKQPTIVCSRQGVIPLGNLSLKECDTLFLRSPSTAGGTPHGMGSPPGAGGAKGLGRPQRAGAASTTKSKDGGGGLRSPGQDTTGIFSGTSANEQKLGQAQLKQDSNGSPSTSSQAWSSFNNSELLPPFSQTAASPPSQAESPGCKAYVAPQEPLSTPSKAHSLGQRRTRPPVNLTMPLSDSVKVTDSGYEVPFCSGALFSRLSRALADSPQAPFPLSALARPFASGHGLPSLGSQFRPNSMTAPHRTRSLGQAQCHAAQSPRHHAAVKAEPQDTSGGVSSLPALASPQSSLASGSTPLEALSSSGARPGVCPEDQKQGLSSSRSKMLGALMLQHVLGLQDPSLVPAKTSIQATGLSAALAQASAPSASQPRESLKASTAPYVSAAMFRSRSASLRQGSSMALGQGSFVTTAMEQGERDHMMSSSQKQQPHDHESGFEKQQPPGEEEAQWASQLGRSQGADAGAAALPPLTQRWQMGDCTGRTDMKGRPALSFPLQAPDAVRKTSPEMSPGLHHALPKAASIVLDSQGMLHVEGMGEPGQGWGEGMGAPGHHNSAPLGPTTGSMRRSASNGLQQGGQMVVSSRNKVEGVEWRGVSTSAFQAPLQLMAHSNSLLWETQQSALGVGGSQLLESAPLVPVGVERRKEKTVHPLGSSSSSVLAASEATRSEGRNVGHSVLASDDLLTLPAGVDSAGWASQGAKQGHDLSHSADFGAQDTGSQEAHSEQPSKKLRQATFEEIMQEAALLADIFDEEMAR